MASRAPAKVSRIAVREYYMANAIAMTAIAAAVILAARAAVIGPRGADAKSVSGAGKVGSPGMAVSLAGAQDDHGTGARKGTVRPIYVKGEANG